MRFEVEHAAYKEKTRLEDLAEANGDYRIDKNTRQDKNRVYDGRFQMYPYKSKDKGARANE